MSDESREAVNENQNRLGEDRLATQEEQITKPAPKAKPQREKDPKKVAAGKKLAEKNRQVKAALERELKREREIAERQQENENSAGWLPEMSFQTVLSIVGMTFTAFELYQRFRQKESSAGGSVVIGEAAVKSPVSEITAEPREEPKQSGAPTSVAGRSDAERSVVQNSEWSERSADQRLIIIIIYFVLATKMSEQNKLVKMVTDSAVLVGLSAGVGYLAKKILKENFLGDPSSNVMNYAKFTGVLAGSMALKTYLEDQKILPKSI